MVAKRETRADRAFSAGIYLILAVLCLVVIYPLYYMLIVSISDGYAVIRGEVSLLPKGVNFGAYAYVLQDRYIPRSYLNTIVYTVFGTLINVVMTALCAYPLSRKKLFGRGFFTMLIVFTMFFDAGIISNFMVVLSLGIKNSIWAILLPPAVNVWYMIIMRTFFSDIPEELHESAYIDGANDLTVFVRIILPLSKAVLATMVVFYAVWHWNSFFPALVYLDDRLLYPMQLILRNMLLESDAGSATVSSDLAVMGRNIKYAAVFITVLPILVVYPFAQKYFVKGVMVGSVKG